MPDKIKMIPKQLLAWWNKFTTKQKTLIISIAALVILTFAILVTVLTKPTYVTLITCSTTKEASEVKNLLEDEGIVNQVSDDGMIISVLKEDLSDATLLLGANSIPADGYSIDNVFSDGFSATEEDKNKKYKLYLEEYIATNLEGMDNIKSASVQLSMPDKDGTILSENEDTYVSVILTLDDKMDDKVAEAIAKSLATAVGNETTDHILIIDSNGNLLFSGDEQDTASGNASTQLEAKAQAENSVKDEVRKVMLGTNLYDNVEVSTNLSMDFSVINQTEHTYSPADGQSQGVLGSESSSSSETTGGTGATPGTDANDGTTYMIQNADGSTSTTTEENKEYLPNEKITETQIPAGAINYDSSSISVVAATYKVYSKDELQKQGALKDMTYDEFKAANSDEVKTDVDQDLYTMVSNATGISEDKISIVAYEVPFFQEDDTSGRTITDYLMMGLIALVLGVLGFVVFRSIKKVPVPVQESELSVENLLASTKEQVAEPVEDFDLNSKSEVRLMIEKFVDENPESVAQLLRNWLNDEWKD